MTEPTTPATHEVGGKPHHGAAGSVCSFNVRVRVDTKKLARVIGEGDHDVVGLLEASHTIEHAMAAAMLNRMCEGSTIFLAFEPEGLINAGNAGFHILTVVTDGYGDMIAEGQKGEELARASVEDVDPDDDAATMRALGDAMRALMENYIGTD